MIDISSVQEKISIRHGGDTKQLEVIFSTDKRIIVEAAAGFGKTNTMISKIAYLIATNQIPKPKKLLALTFSVNAAFKIKKDLLQQLPELLYNEKFNLNEKVYTSNYHGFCRSILRKHGYLLHDNLNEIDKFQSIDDSKQENNLNYGLNLSEAKILSDFNSAVKKSNMSKVGNNLNTYCDIVINKLIVQNIIPYNAILSLVIFLFKTQHKVLEFYKKYFVAILVDEFQDTNYLSWWLLHSLIHENNDIKVIFLGDPLQRIYGFIGAVPNLMNLVIDKYSMKEIKLDKNYRFKDNEQMLLLDYNIRKNAENPQNPNINHESNISFQFLIDQENESRAIFNQINQILAEDCAAKITILTKQRGNNINYIINDFKEKGIPYFYGLFTDDDTLYTQFNRECLFQFIELIKDNYIVNKSTFNKLVKIIKGIYQDESNVIYNSLISLLEIFKDRFFIDFAFSENEEKINFIKDTFESNGLKQYMEFIDENIIFSTIHGAKGLEWDYVILVDMESYSFPNYYGLCGVCGSQSNCNLTVTANIQVQFLEELSVFYVGVTRAKKQVYFTASEKQINYQGNQIERNISCFLKLKGININ